MTASIRDFTQQIIVVLSGAMLLIATCFIGLSYHFATHIGKEDQRLQLESWLQECSTDLALSLNSGLSNKNFADEPDEIAGWAVSYLRNVEEQNPWLTQLDVLLCNPQGEAIVSAGTSATHSLITHLASPNQDVAATHPNQVLVAHPVALASSAVPVAFIFAAKAPDATLYSGLSGFAAQVMGFLALLIICAVTITRLMKRLPSYHALARAEAKTQACPAEATHGCTPRPMPAIQVRFDNSITHSSGHGTILLTHWNLREGEKVRRPSLCNLMQEVRSSKSERSLNVEIEKRLYHIRFELGAQNQSILVHADDITEKGAVQALGKIQPARSEKHVLTLSHSSDYASRIQASLLPGESSIKTCFENAFAIRANKEKVSRDFFWVHELIPQERYLLALGGSTSHGMSAGMLSIIGHGLLKDIVEQQKCAEPALILKILNTELNQALRQKNRILGTEGLNLALLFIDVKRMRVTFAGTHPPCYWMNGKLNILHSEQQPLGLCHGRSERTFSSQSFSISKGDCIYLFSEVLTDVLNDPGSEPVQRHIIEELIQTHHKERMQTQSIIFQKTFEKLNKTSDHLNIGAAIGIKF